MTSTETPIETRTRRAAFAPTSLNAEARTVDVVWTTGAAVLRNSYGGQSFESLSLDPAHVRLDRLNNGAPFLADHDGLLSSVMGVVVPGSARIVKGAGVATVRFAAEGISAEADKLFALVRDGVVQNISVGYRTYKTEKIAGGDATIPTFRAIDWQPYELSAVAMGADDSAGFRSANSSPTTQDRSNKLDLNEVQSNTIAQDETARVHGIKTACKRAGIGADLERRFLAEGISLDNTREQILECLAARSDAYAIDGHLPASEQGGHGITGGVTAQEKFMRGATAALLHRSGHGESIAHAATSKIPEVRRAFKGFDVDEDGGELRGATLPELARECLERSGVSTRLMSREKMVGIALTRSAGSNTQSDFAVLLENVMYKTLLGSYSTASDTWRRFAKTDTVQDFRPSPRYRTGSFGVLDTLAEGGEFKNKSIPDGLKTSITVETRGNMIALTREAIINDDIGALTDTVGKFGRAAGLSIEKSVYDLLALNGGLGPTMGDTLPFFHSSRFNVSTGAALTMAGIEADRVVLASQKDPSNNEFLSLKPKCLLIPVALGGEANALNRSLYDPTAGSAVQRPNVVGGLFSDVIDSPRISGTRRYLFADSGEAAAIVVAFLNGTQSPFMDQQIGWRIDGTEWKLRLDFKAQMFDPKGAITNAGV